MAPTSKRTCTLPDCDRPLIARELCAMHYQRLMLRGTTDPRPSAPPKPPCSVEGCGKKSASLGWCAMHYRRWRVNNTLDDPAPRTRASCSVEGCDSPTKVIKGYCGRHAYRIEMHGDPGQATRLYREPAAPDAVCEIDDCDRGGLLRRGWCTIHYQRWQKHGDPTREPEVFPDVCTIDGCEREHASLGLCTTHYMRLRRTGTTDDPPPFIPPACSVDDCEMRAEKLGLCSKHHARWKRRGTTDKPAKEWNRSATGRCEVGACDATHRARGMCDSHYAAWVHRKNRERANARMRRHYRENREYYLVRSIQRRRIGSLLSEDDRELTIAYRLAIANDPCSYCGRPGENNDHVFPIAKGGTDHWWNLTRACEQCNKRKAAHCGTWWHLKRGSWIEPARSVPPLAEAG